MFPFCKQWATAEEVKNRPQKVKEKNESNSISVNTRSNWRNITHFNHLIPYKLLTDISSTEKQYGRVPNLKKLGENLKIQAE